MILTLMHYGHLHFLKTTWIMKIQDRKPANMIGEVYLYAGKVKHRDLRTFAFRKFLY
jgi:hypothetical protein